MTLWYWCLMLLCALAYTGYCREIGQNLQVQDEEDPIFKDYRSAEELYKFYESLVEKYPKIMKMKSIGKTYENRDIMVIIISNGNSSNKKVFIDGGIHAREWISPATVTYLIYHIALNYQKDSGDMQNTDWYIVPIINVDGYEYTRTPKNRMWRKNRKPTSNPKCIGTDLNRNFGFKWGLSGSSSNSCAETFKGSAPFSEPESKALSDFIINSNVTFSVYLTYHSFSQLILYPWGYSNNKTENDKDLISLGNEMHKAIYDTNKSVYKVKQSCGLYPAAGASDDWAKSIGIEYSYTIELPDRGYYGLELPPEYIVPVGKEILASLQPVIRRIHKH